MLQRALESGVPAARVTADAEYGSDRRRRVWLEQPGVVSRADGKEREARQEVRFSRLEGLIGSALNKNPFQEYLEIKQQVEAIEGPRQIPTVTDQSPAVQLIKDQSDKLNKNMNRVVGLLERAMLRGQDEVIPEEHSTPKERDQRAERLLGRMQQAGRSRELWRELFGK